ncbi:NADPH-dependent FMN reductase [Streptobacillus canis]|uniref:NADPH-dependent FMN reductase n=1 Tax=Streptobacillus canis TaxID=2678686 RepID=UPI001E3EA3A3|nr:NADPH-dependent FMN reductase [Streptobacillus canis]
MFIKKGIINYAKSKFEGKGYKSEQVDYLDVPFYTEDIEFPTPESINRIREQFKNADMIFIATTEYNGSIPGVFKNLLDWISRRYLRCSRICER